MKKSSVTEISNINNNRGGCTWKENVKIQGGQDNLLTSESLFLPLLLQGRQMTIYVLTSPFNFFRSLSNANGNQRNTSQSMIQQHQPFSVIFSPHIFYNYNI